jgi:hypothetical protein
LLLLLLLLVLLVLLVLLLLPVVPHTPWGCLGQCRGQKCTPPWNGSGKSRHLRVTHTRRARVRSLPNTEQTRGTPLLLMLDAAIAYVGCWTACYRPRAQASTPCCRVLELSKWAHCATVDTTRVLARRTRVQQRRVCMDIHF